MLVETFEEGEAMLEVMRASEDSDTSKLKKHLAEIGVDALLKMVCGCLLELLIILTWGLAHTSLSLIVPFICGCLQTTWAYVFHDYPLMWSPQRRVSIQYDDDDDDEELLKLK